MFKKKFIFKENYLTIRKNSLKKRILRWNTNQSANVFLRIGDTISLDPIIKGFHEEGLSKFISYVAKNKYNDYFIDIGANIGLMSCQNKDQFKSFYMFEPNPYCFKLLEINAALNLNINKCHFFNFGLGEKNKKVKLFVPKFNWGGAFISDSNITTISIF